MANEFDVKTQFVIDSLDGILEFNDFEKGYIKSAIVYVHEAVPTDITIIFKKQESIISSMEDIEYLIARLKSRRKEINNLYKAKKDPAYTSLVLKGRPSDTARDCEVRTKVPELSEFESQLETIDYLTEYLYHIKDSLNKLYLDIRDRLMISKDGNKYG